MRYILFALLLVPLTGLAEPLRVGVVLPLSGAGAEYGNAALHGFELAMKEHPQGQVAFRFEDSRFDARTAVTIFERFRAEGDVSMIFLWGFAMNQAVAPLAEANRFPVIGVSADSALSVNRKYVIRFCYPGDQVGGVLLESLRRRGAKRLGVLKTELAFNNAVFDGIKSRLAPGETLELVDSFGFDDNDFKSSIAKTAARKFDALGFFLLPGQISQAFRTVEQLHISTRIFSTDFMDSQEIVEASGKSAEGTLIASQHVEPAFAARYHSVFGNDIQVSWAANAYDFALLTAKLFPEGHVNSEEILNRYRNSAPYPGVSGTLRYDEHAAGPAFLFDVEPKQVRNGRFETVTNN